MCRALCAEPTGAWLTETGAAGAGWPIPRRGCWRSAMASSKGRSRSLERSGAAAVGCAKTEGAGAAKTGISTARGGSAAGGASKCTTRACSKLRGAARPPARRRRHARKRQRRCRRRAAGATARSRRRARPETAGQNCWRRARPAAREQKPRLRPGGGGVGGTLDARGNAALGGSAHPRGDIRQRQRRIGDGGRTGRLTGLGGGMRQTGSRGTRRGLIGVLAEGGSLRSSSTVRCTSSQRRHHGAGRDRWPAGRDRRSRCSR